MAENGGGRKIIHVDMDAFFAAIEQRDEPKFRNKPLIVGGNPWGRGVVATCSYEARRYGIHSAMPSRRAVELCPHAIFLPPRMEYYATISKKIFAIFSEFSHLVEPLSIDEAFLDVTHNFFNEPSATRLARQLQRQIFSATQLTASAGVSFNPFLAKVASSVQKPNGLTVIPPERARKFLDALPIIKFYGVGPATAKKLEARQIFFGADLFALSQKTLEEILGRTGNYLYHMVRGIDQRPIVANRERQSLGKEVTFAEDLREVQDACQALRQLSSIVAAALREENLRGRTVTLKLRYDNFESITRSITLAERIDGEDDILAAAEGLLLSRTEALTRRIRLLGITVSSFTEPKCSGEVGWIQDEFPFMAQLRRQSMA
ncbi:MAG: DNA polymerase IV [Puniceicoccales bacterium]|jgi:DNA polymerase-4|nr:DNA polymerase IV [Puniceicoccales bacterium]